MNKQNQLSDNELGSIFGGSITYNPDMPGAQTGNIGINYNYTHRYNSESDVLNYVSAHYQDKIWKSIEERDNYLFQGLIEAGIIF